MSMAFGAKLQLQPGSWMETAYDVIIGIIVGASHSLNMLRKNLVNSSFVQAVFKLFGLVYNDEDAPSTKRHEGLKVVGVGYGRTGTVRWIFHDGSLVLFPDEGQRWRTVRLLRDAAMVSWRRVPIFLKYVRLPVFSI